MQLAHPAVLVTEIKEPEQASAPVNRLKAGTAGSGLTITTIELLEALVQPVEVFLTCRL